MEGAYQSCKLENDDPNVRSNLYSSISLGGNNGKSTANLPSSSMPRNIVGSNTLALARGKAPERSCCKAIEAPEQWAPAGAPAPGHGPGPREDSNRLPQLPNQARGSPPPQSISDCRVYSAGFVSHTVV